MIFKRIGWFEGKSYNVEVKALPHGAILLKADREWVYELFPRMKEREWQLAGTLSGGEQQRVALARALINRPPILLCDEPTGNLDPKNSWEIMKLLEQINKKGTTILVVTHNREIVNEMQKRVITSPWRERLQAFP